MMSKTPLLNWIESNRGKNGFGESLVDLLGFACAEWLRRCRGRVLSKDAAFYIFLSSHCGYDVGEWATHPEDYAEKIADFCEKSKELPLPEAISVDFPEYLDLRGVVCPGNAVRARLALAGLPEGFRIKIALDEGSPIENVPQALVADGHNVVFREKKANFWEITVVKRGSM